MKYLFLLIFLISDLIVITSLQKDQSFANDLACADPIARVVNINHSMYRFGTPVCLEKKLQVNEKEPLKVVCRHSPKIVEVKQAINLSICPKSRYDMLPASENEVVRGNVKTNPTLLNPYGVTLRETQVMLRWKPVANATYKVTIDDGYGDYRSFNTVKNSALVNLLKPGVSYQVVIYSNKYQKSTSIFRILSNDQNKELSSLLKSLDLYKSQMPTEDYTHLKIAFLDKFNLANESILFAALQHRKYPGNSKITRGLGDLFVKASRPDLALMLYQDYLDTAQQKNIEVEIADAQQRIQYVTAQMKL
jgi:hypothetical protein